MGRLRRRTIAFLLLFAATLSARAAGVSTQELVLGQSAPLSGPFAALGNDYRNGAMLAFDQVNAAGGIHDRPIRLVTLDDAYDAGRARTNAEDLIHRHHALAFFNHMFTNTVRASLPIAQSAGIPYFGPYTGMPELYLGDRPRLFVTRASFAEELDKILDQLTSVGYRRIGLAYYEGTTGEEFRSDVEAGLHARHRELVGSAAMAFGGSAVPAVRSMVGIAPDVVILGVSGADAVAFIRAELDANLRPAYFTRSLVDSRLLHEVFGKQAEGIVITQLVPSPFRVNPEQLIVREYLQLLAAAGRSAPSYVEFEGFLNARVMILALRRMAEPPSPVSLAGALSGLGQVDLGGYVVDLSPGHRHRFVELTMLRADGTFAH